MGEFPKGGLIGRLVHFIRYFTRHKIPLFASNASFFIILSLFPSLVLLLGLLRYTGIGVNTLTELLRGVVPSALMPAAKKLILSTYQNTSGAIVSVSAVTALWSASRGIYGLLTGLNSIYGVSESRGYLYTRGVSVVYTFVFLLVLLLTLVLHVFGTAVSDWLYAHPDPILSLVTRLVDLRFFLLLAVQTAVFTAMFTVLPNQRNRIRESLPGALLASSGWLVFSDLFSIYVEHFAGYANVYGSVYAVALSMLWLYCCISILFCGGVLNRYLVREKKP